MTQPLKNLTLLSIAGLTSMTCDLSASEYQQPHYTREGAYNHYWKELSYTSNPFQVNEATKAGDQSIQIVDLRSPEAFTAGHVPGAINLPPEQWGNLESLNSEKMIVVYCYNITCNLAKNAALHFISQGFDVKEMMGGWQSWTDLNYPVAKSR